MTKSITLLAGTMLACSFAYAQGNTSRTIAGNKSVTPVSISQAARVSTVPCQDTLNTDIAGLTVYTVTPAAGQVTGGYLAGTNRYNDVAKANYFPNTGTRTITDVLFIFARASTAAANNTQVNFKVWSGASGTPGAALGTKSVPLTAIAQNVVDQDYTLVTFDTPITVTGGFFVGVEIPATANDTIALAQSTSPDASPIAGWEQWSDNTWSSYAGAWGSAANPFSSRNAIFPVLDFDLTAGFTAPTTLNLSNGNTVTFTNTSTGGSVNSWSFSGGNPATSSAASPTVTFNTPGTYTVTLTHSTPGGCTETFTQQLEVSGISAVNEALAGKVNLYPNPANSKLTIEMPSLSAKQIVVTNAIGQVVKQITPASEAISVNVAGLSNGMYFVRIETTEGTIIKKFNILN